MPLRNAGTDHCHAITAPSSARLRPSALRKLMAFAILFLRLPNALSAVLPAIEQRRTMSEASSLIVSAKPARREHVPLGILYMVGATIVFAASSAVSKWLVASYPIGEVNGARRVPHAAPWPSRAAFGLARLLADVPADRVQPDAARRRHRHQLLLAAVCDPGLGAAAQRSGGPGALARAARGLLRRAHRHRAGSGGVPGWRAVRAGERRPLRLGHGGRARNDRDRIGADLDPLPAGAAHRLLRAAVALGWTSPTPVDAAWIVFNGVSNAVGQYWWTRALHLAPASAVAPFFYLSLIWASILGFAVWGDVPTVSLVIGSAVVVASGLFLLWRESNARQARLPASE